jgi:thioredoxin-dependent peroxiredoxin
MSSIIDRLAFAVALVCCFAAAGVVAAVGGCRDDGANKKAAPPPAEKPEAPAEGKLLAVGAEAPDFESVAHDGKAVRLSELRGSPVVLYFYPKDETPGCTAEAEAFRDDSAELKQLGARVIGVSLDTIESHREFAQNHGLNFPLLADTNGAIAAKYGVSTRSGFAERVTFIIGSDGKVARVFPEVRVGGHSDEVLVSLREVSKTSASAGGAQ